MRLLRLSSQQADMIERLNESQPGVLVRYASVLEALAYQEDRLRLTRLKQVANNSEQLSARALRRICKTLCVNVLHHYGAGECLFLSDGCRTDGGAHGNADWAILEVVDDDYRAVPSEQTGCKVLVTNLANMMQPFIRYAAFLSNALENGLPPTVKVDVRMVDAMELDPVTGKFQRMICRIGPPPELTGAAL